MSNDREVLESSVQSPAKATTHNFVLRWAMTNELLPAWWSGERDRYFREYWPGEDFVSSTIYSITARNTQFTWHLTGLQENVERAQQLLQGANFGKGWNNLIQKTSIDFLTQDNGAFWEIIRPARVQLNGDTLPAVKQVYEGEEPEWFAVKQNKLIPLKDTQYKIYDSPLDMPTGIAHLDAGQVQRTGNPEIPAIYTDRYGKMHRMRPWQIVDFSDMESPIESMNGVGICALSRVFRTSHILQSVMIYKDEKVSGRYNRAIHITNADPDLLQDQIEQTASHNNNIGARRYSQPVIASTFDPSATPSVATIELSSYPDGFDEGDTNNWAVAVLALGFGVDYGFLAPLPGKGLGTSAQSETQAKAAKGKSSRQFMSMITQSLNFRGILPASTQFQFDDNDIDAQESQEKMSKMRAETRKMMIDNGEITSSVARQMAVDDGDLSRVYLSMMGTDDVTPVVTTEGESNIEAEIAIEEEIKQYKLGNHQIQTTQNRLFKKRNIGQKIFHTAYKLFGKKQIQIPESASPEIEDVLINYAEELELLAIAAASGELEQADFEAQLTELVIGGIIGIYAQQLGKSVNELTPEDLIPLSHILEANERSILAISNDIYSGRYDEEEGLGIPGLLLRLGLWVSSAASSAWIGKIFNDASANKKFEWVLNPLKENCESCLALNGQVHTGSVWRDFAVYPQSTRLFCFGLHCGCSLVEVSDNTQTRGDLGNVPLN